MTTKENVVPLFGKKKKSDTDSASEPDIVAKSGEESVFIEVKTTEPKESFTFEEIMKKNEENRERLRQDRKKANKGVIRSYKLKN